MSKSQRLVPALMLNDRSPRRCCRDITRRPSRRGRLHFDRSSISQPEWSCTLGTNITLTASDGFKLGGYRAEPQGKPKGGLVVIQEIFGVNHHIRAMCDRFAAVGYVSTAPAVFDRIQPNFESGYSPDEIAKARAIIPKIDWAALLRDVAAAIDNVKPAGK